MLKTRLLHPDLAAALATAGHGAKVLLADGNYPVTTMAPRRARLIALNLTPGIVSVTDVLRVLVDTVPIEAAEVMVPESGPEPPIFAEFRALLEGATGNLAASGGGAGPAEITLAAMDRFAFYKAASQEVVAVVVATGEQRIYANLLLTIGVVPPPA